jgi:hypothetical protein
LVAVFEDAAGHGGADGGEGGEVGGGGGVGVDFVLELSGARGGGGLGVGDVRGIEAVAEEEVEEGEEEDQGEGEALAGSPEHVIGKCLRNGEICLGRVHSREARLFMRVADVVGEGFFGGKWECVIVVGNAFGVGTRLVFYFRSQTRGDYPPHPRKSVKVTSPAVTD